MVDSSLSEIISIWLLNVATNVKFKLLWYQMVLCAVFCFVMGVYLIEMGWELMLIVRHAGKDYDHCTVFNLVCYSSTVFCSCSWHVTIMWRKKLSRFPERHVCLGLLLAQDNAQWWSAIQRNIQCISRCTFSSFLGLIFFLKRKQAVYSIPPCAHVSTFCIIWPLSRNLVEQMPTPWFLMS
jgi:hypothetical protein